MLRAIVLVLLAAPTLWGCVSLDQHAALREAYNKLDKDRTTNQAATQAAKSELAKVSGQLQRVQQEVKDLEAKLQKANQEMTELSAQLDAAKNALAAQQKADEERAKHAKDTKPAQETKSTKPPPKRKKP
jgi:peptidoglycan hydrolase CwlO-like protein